MVVTLDLLLQLGSEMTENSIYTSYTISFSDIQKMSTYCHDINYFVS